MNITINEFTNNLVNLDGEIEVKHYNGEELETIASGNVNALPNEAREREIRYIYAQGNVLIIEVE